MLNHLVRKRCVIGALLLAGLVDSSVGQEQKEMKLPQIPDSVLLAGYPGWELAVVSPKKRINLQWRSGGNASPSISRQGTTVALTRVESRDENTGEYRVVVVSFSLQDEQWTEYPPAIPNCHSVAISPDGTKIAFAAPEVSGGPFHIFVIDRRTHSRLKGPEIGLTWPEQLSWSPDGRRIAFDMDVDTGSRLVKEQPSIRVVDLQDGSIFRVAHGESPAWSPSGEWIAFLAFSGMSNIGEPDQLVVTHPDGTGGRVLWTVRKERWLGILGSWQRLFRQAPVWSPDSTALLANELVNADKTTFDVHLVELADGTHKRIAHDTPPVYGWVSATALK